MASDLSTETGTTARVGPSRTGAGPRAADASGATGRDESVRRLVDAAAELFAARGPDGVSLRQVAAAAGVNYGLIHQYIGTKDELLRLVFRSVSEQAAQRVVVAGDLDHAIDELIGAGHKPSRYVTMLAWALLQGRDASELLGRSPALTAVVERMQEADDVPRDPRVRVASAVALNLGWQLFGTFLCDGVGLEPDEAVERERRELVRSVLLGGPVDDGT
jgi:TetR/AcrR family transcriptional regulator, repressor for neighboring sulfatase